MFGAVIGLGLIFGVVKYFKQRKDDYNSLEELLESSDPLEREQLL